MKHLNIGSTFHAGLKGRLADWRLPYAEYDWTFPKVRLLHLPSPSRERELKMHGPLAVKQGSSRDSEDDRPSS